MLPSGTTDSERKRSEQDAGVESAGRTSRSGTTNSRMRWRYLDQAVKLDSSTEILELRNSVAERQARAAQLASLLHRRGIGSRHW